MVGKTGEPYMKILRYYIRQKLLESRFKQITKSKYRDLDSYIKNAPFLDEPADQNALDYDFPEDYDDNDDTDLPAMLPVADQLQDDLNTYFADSSRFKGLAGKISVIVNVNDTSISGKGDGGKTIARANYN